MKVLARPVGKNNKAEEETDATADGDHKKSVLCYLKHVMNPVAGQCDQVEGE